MSLSSGLPVIADADTGFGEGEMSAKTVNDYFQAGASGNKIILGNKIKIKKIFFFSIIKPFTSKIKFSLSVVDT